MERKYYEDIGYKPFLFFMVFGVSADELQVSREKHKVDGIPEGLDIASLTRPDHSDYIDSILGGEIGNQLMKADSDLYQNAKILINALCSKVASKTTAPWITCVML